MAAFVALFDEAAFQQVLREISGAVSFIHDGSPRGVKTRYHDSADKNLVGDYLFEKLVGYGYTVEFDDFIYNGTPCRNLVATKTGVTSPDEYVVVGGHYDSTSEQPAALAPGAEDNGSGSSLVMEVARMAAEPVVRVSHQISANCTDMVPTRESACPPQRMKKGIIGTPRLE